MRYNFKNPTFLVFLGIIVVVLIWLGSGMIGRGPDIEPTPPGRPLPTVATAWSEAEEITREIVLYGDVVPNQISILRARTDGVVESAVSTGTRVAAGEIVAHLSHDDREARLARARSQEASAQRQYQAILQLYERGVATETELNAQLAQLEAARADLSAIELEIANTALRAPIAGVVNRVMAELGSYVTIGGEVLEIIDNNPLLAVVHIQQATVDRVRPGMPAEVRFIGAEERTGTIRFVSPLADAGTRTFRVEVEVDNTDPQLPSGMSAEVVIPFETVAAHQVSTALVRLDEQGRIGLHTVGADERIEFVPIDVVRARADGIWVTGLPPRARIVTISEGALSPGQQVEARQSPAGFADLDR
ncbi:MAG: efflux RND transporter periplasmic adaptor subunit [Wenzhouxiangella sp.]